jgi:hypothetical protein
VTIGDEEFRLGVVPGTAGITQDLFFQFSGAGVLPGAVTGTSTISAPFLLTGALTYLPGGTLPSSRVPFSGAGSATAFLASSDLQPTPGWRVTRLEYQFDSDLEPVPEPSTLLLVGSGVLLIARRKLRGRGLPAER